MKKRWNNREIKWKKKGKEGKNNMKEKWKKNKIQEKWKIKWMRKMKR